MIRIVKTKYGNIYINKESGNLFVKNKNKESMPVMYGVYSSENEPMGLWDYKNIRGLDLVDAVKELLSINAVLIGNTFDIGFYDVDAVNKFHKILEVN